MAVQLADVADQRVDEFGLDCALHQQPAVVGEVRQLVGIRLIDVPGRRQGRRRVSQSGLSVHRPGSVTSGLKAPGIGGSLLA